MNIARKTTRSLTLVTTALLIAAGGARAQDMIYNSPTGSTTTITTTTNAARLFVGVDEPNNELYVESGGRVDLDLLAEVGQLSTATNSLLSVKNGGLVVIGAANTNNLPASGMLVGDSSGAGELQVNYDSKILTDDLIVGAGQDETGGVSARNGGSIEIAGDLVVGATNNMNNVVAINDGGELVLNDAASVQINNIAAATENLNEVNIEAGGALLIKGDLNAPDLISKSGLNFASGSTLGVGGELTTAGNSINDGLNIVLDDALSTNHVAHWDASSIDVGSDTANNSLSIENGAAATSAGLVFVGKDVEASDNRLTVTGSNSTFTASDKVFVGANGSRNKLEVLDGATATMTQDVKLGTSSSSSQNSITASGTNSVLSAGADLYVGVSGANNTMTVSDAAELDVSGRLVVGELGDNNTLTIDNADAAIADAVILGAVGNNNTLQVRGANGALTTANMIVGGTGGQNELSLSDGALVEISDDLVIGRASGDNLVQLSGSNTTLRVGSDVIVGANGNGNKLNVFGGALEAGANVRVGFTNQTENSVVLISGSDARLEVANDLFIGSTASSNNSVAVNSGGVLEVADRANIVFGAATNNTLTIGDGGTLKTVDWNATATDSNLTFATGSGLWLSGQYGGTNEIGGGFSVTLDGAGAAWTATNNLHVGMNTDDNSLTITNGATATALKSLYIGEAASDNLVTVAGAGSTLNITEDLHIGTADSASLYNTLEALEGAGVNIGGDAALYRGATLKIDSTSQVEVAGDYSQDKYSSLEIGVSSNQVAPNLVVDGTAAFASTYDKDQNSIIKVFNDGVAESNTIAIVRADAITLDGSQATGGSFEANIASNALLGFTVTLTNDLTNYYIVLSDFLERSVGEAGGLEGQLLDVADEIEFLAEGGTSNAMEMIDIISQLQPEAIAPTMDDYYGEKSSSAPANNLINLGLQNVADQLTTRADNTRARSGTASARVDWNNSAGVAGPHQVDQELQGWVSAYGVKGSKSSTDGFKSYDTSLGGFMIGADMSVAEGVLVGVAGGSGSGTANAGGGAQSDTKTIYGALYSSFGTKTWFADANLIYAGSDIDSNYGTTFDTRASYDARNVAIHLGGGKEITGDYLIWTPQLSFLGNYYSQDAYQEQSSNTVGRDVDGFSSFYLNSNLGTSMAMYMAMGDVVFKPELRLFWQHEWNAKQEELNYRLIGGSNNYNLFVQAPEKDLVKLGLGSSAKIGEFLELRADLDARLGKSYRDYTLFGSLRYQF